MAAGREFIWVLLQLVFKQMMIFFFYYKYPRFCLSLKNVQACLEKGIFDGEGLKSWKSIHVLDKTKKPHT